MVVVAIIAVGSYQFPKVQNQVQEVLGGVVPGGTFTNPVELLGGTVMGNVISTSTTATAMTLNQGNIVNVDTMIVTPLVGDLTYTFMASSSARNLVPRQGQRQEWCVLNATTTSGIEVIFAAGTGIDLEIATTTSNLPTVIAIQAGSVGCFKFVRDIATSTTAAYPTDFNIHAAFQPYYNAD